MLTYKFINFTQVKNNFFTKTTEKANKSGAKQMVMMEQQIGPIILFFGDNNKEKH